MSAKADGDGGGIDRRTFMRGTAATVGAGAAMYAADPVQESEAIVPAVLAGGAAAKVAAGVGVATLGWAVLEYSPLGGEDPPEGLTAEALEKEVLQAAKVRESTNASTIIDNRNILEGIENVAYTDGKLDAIEALNADKSQSEVQDEGLVALDDYFTTVKRNYLKTWNEAADELQTLAQAVEDHTEITLGDLFAVSKADGSVHDIQGHLDVINEDYELPDGSMMTVRCVTARETNYIWNPIEVIDGVSPPFQGIVVDPSGSGVSSLSEADVSYMRHSADGGTGWVDVWDDLDTAHDTVSDGIITWVDNVYEQVQSGEIDTADLLTVREQAEMWADEERVPQAVADLVALNIPVDPDREATIHLTEQDITLSGMLAPTSEPDEGIESGVTYDPTTEPWDLYFTYDVAGGSGTWGEVEQELLDRELVLTEEPYPGTIYRAPTETGTAEAVTADFVEEERDGSAVWVVDVSDQIDRLEESWTAYEDGIDGGEVTFTDMPDVDADFEITNNEGETETVSSADFTDEGDGTYTADTDLGISEIEEVTAYLDKSTLEEETINFYADDDSAEEFGYSTVQITEEFTVEKIEDSDGNEVDSAEFTQSEPHDDENYITQEEWEEMRDRNEELIQKYEEALGDDGDGFFGGGWFDFEGSGGILGGVVIGILVFVGLVKMAD